MNAILEKHLIHSLEHGQLQTRNCFAHSYALSNLPASESVKSRTRIFSAGRRSSPFALPHTRSCRACISPFLILSPSLSPSKDINLQYSYHSDSLAWRTGSLECDILCAMAPPTTAASVLWGRDVSSDFNNAKTTLSSWDNCMSKAYCK